MKKKFPFPQLDDDCFISDWDDLSGFDCDIDDLAATLDFDVRDLGRDLDFDLNDFD